MLRCLAPSQSIEKMYHGLVAHMLVVNSPSTVKAIYRIVRPILPAYIQERVNKNQCVCAHLYPAAGDGSLQLSVCIIAIKVELCLCLVLLRD